MCDPLFGFTKKNQRSCWRSFGFSRGKCPVTAVSGVSEVFKERMIKRWLGFGKKSKNKDSIASNLIVTIPSTRYDPPKKPKTRSSRSKKKLSRKGKSSSKGGSTPRGEKPSKVAGKQLPNDPTTLPNSKLSPENSSTVSPTTTSTPTKRQSPKEGEGAGTPRKTLKPKQRHSPKSKSKSKPKSREQKEQESTTPGGHSQPKKMFFQTNTCLKVECKLPIYLPILRAFPPFFK